MTAFSLLMLNCGGGALPSGNGFTNPSSGGGTPGTIGAQGPITVVVSPSSVNVAPGAQVKFAATVQNATTNSSVMWSVNGIPGGNATVGTISASGTYQAPPTPPNPNSVLVTATSLQDTSKQGTAVVVISTPASTVTVSASPAAVTLQTGASTVFTAVVSGTANSSVSWRVNGVPGGDAINGTITAGGVYTAPAAVPPIPTVTIEAVSVADPSAIGIAAVTVIQRVQISLSPTNVMVGTFLTQQFVATVTGTTNTAVAWSINGIPGGDAATVGTISSSGLYTAPNAVPLPNNVVTLTATSIADPTAVALASISIVDSSGVTVSISPGSASLEVNRTLILNVTTSGLYKGVPPSPQVTWVVNGVLGGDAIVGTVVPTACPGPVPSNVVCGLYSAPAAVPVPNTVTLTAINTTDPGASANATVLITAPAVVTVAVAPSSSTVQVNATQQFTATVTGTTNQTVNWSVNGIPGGNATVGTITAAGLYTAPAAVPAAGTVLITATSQADPTATGSATVTVSAAPPVITVSVSPQNAMVRVNSQLQFTASVSGTSVQTVNWSLGCTGGGCGTITSTGLYTAPANVPASNVTVTATSTQAPNPTGTSTVTVLPTATISMNPATASVPVGLGVQFFVTVSGLANTAVNFAVNGIPGGNASVGTISSSGLYIAPAAAPTPNPVSVTATSVADPSLVATSSVTVTVPVVVMVAPSAASIALSGTQQFTATVTGAANTVTWAVNGIAGGNATVGTIDATGLYTAPASLLLTQTFAITATHTVSTTAVGNATVTVNVPVSVAISPTPTASLQVGLTLQFSATVTGTTNTGVTWSISGTGCTGAACGTITTNGFYTAPTTVPTGGVVRVTATSVADTTKTAFTDVTITPGPAVSVSPNPATINAGGTQQFTATVTNAPTTTVSWSVDPDGSGPSPAIPGGNATVGTIDSTGLYTSPNGLTVTQTFTITAQSTSAPSAVGSAMLTVVVPISVAVSPPSASVRVNTTQTFAATVTGSSNQTVTWTVGGACGSNCGTINTNSGVYTAPSSVPAGAVTVTATSAADNTKTGTATVTVTQAVAVTVSPVMASVTVNTTQQFMATVTGATITTVTWSVSCASAACGSINAAGLYTAPAAVPASNVTISATSQDGSNTVGTASVTVLPVVTVSVAPATVTLTVTQGQQFTATVTGTANTAVNWSVDPDGAAGPAAPIAGGNATVGIINSNGAYSAPATVPTPSTVEVIAVSAADPTKSASAGVTITPPPVGVFVSVFPRNVNLPVGRTQQFKAHVIRTNNQSVTWSVNAIVGGNSTFGTIDAFGVYSPPSTVPAAPNITITASSTVAAASATVNARIVPNVAVSPSSHKITVATTKQFTATVSGTANTSVVWAVEGITGGNPGVGTITAAGLYTAPTSIPRPGTVTVTATSVADPTAQSGATITILAKTVQIAPSPASIMPGAHLAFLSNTHLFPAAGAGGTPLTWTVNGVAGGSAATGTINTAGVYVAPPTPQTVTIEAISTVDPTKKATDTVTVTLPTGASPVTLHNTLIKIRPYDIVTGVTPPLGLPVAGNQYASWQVLVEGRGEDLTGVNVTVSNFTNSMGNTIPASNAVIYLEKYVNAFYPTRTQADVGEYPDPLIPKVDPFVNETRNAFPFSVNRISPAYKQPPRAGGDTVNTGLGAGRAVSGGTYTGTTVKHFVVQIDRAGGIGSATFKWSSDGGATFQASNVPTSATPVPLSDGVTVAFQSGNLTGVTDFMVGNAFWIFAGPNRNQPVWIDMFVPGNTPPGTYNGSVTVVRAGKTNVVLNVSIVVRAFVLPVTAGIPSYFGMNWTNLVNAHFLTPAGPQTLTLGHLYGTACLINRISCDTANAFPPTFTFDPTTGAVLTSNYASYDQATAPLANGSITPHGEQLTAIRMPRAGITTSEEFFAADNMVTAFTTRGWRSRLFDFSFDEPGTPMDFDTAMRRSSVVRSVDESIRVVVTTDISQANFNLIGYVNRWTPQFVTLENKEFLDGPNPSARALYSPLLQPPPAGRMDELWWYPSCRNHDCNGTGASPRFDNYPTFTWDVPALLNRSWGLMAASPYRVQGVLYQDTVLAYSRFFNMSLPRVDVWESTYYAGGNGEGTLFYPGRPSDIGGNTHIPVESMRLKQIRDAIIDQELAAFLNLRGESPFVENTILGAENDEYILNVDPNSYLGASRSLLGQAASPPLPPLINLPPAGICYTDPVSGNKVCTVTDPVLCPNGGNHYYSYWPVWNASATHFIVDCLGFQGGGQIKILVKDDLSTTGTMTVLGNVLAGSPNPSLKAGLAMWSWTDPNSMFVFGVGASSTKLFRWNPFTRTLTLLKDFAGMTFGTKVLASINMAYVSFDDRFFLFEFADSTGIKFGLAVWDSSTNATTFKFLTDLCFGATPCSFYDEAIMTKDNFVWVKAQDSAGVAHGYRWNTAFTSAVVLSFGGHNAQGQLADGTPVVITGGPNCPTNIFNYWRPAGIFANEFTGAVNALYDCTAPEQIEWAHYSWNSTQRDKFFISTWGFGTVSGPLQNGVVKVKINYNTSNQVTGTSTELVAHHRSEKRFGYPLTPRATCNQQGTRCLFTSSMTVQTNNVNPQSHVYVAIVPVP